MGMARYLWIAVLLNGCIANKPVALPNGQQGIAVDCSGAGYNWSYCMNKAAKACKGPYQIVSQDGDSAGSAPMGNMTIALEYRTMIVACGK